MKKSIQRKRDPLAIAELMGHLVASVLLFMLIASTTVVLLWFGGWLKIVGSTYLTIFIDTIAYGIIFIDLILFVTFIVRDISRFLSQTKEGGRNE